MSFFRTTFLLATGHFTLIVLLFLLFGLGLEGKRNIGHDILWIPGPILIILPLNSLVWGCALSVILQLIHISRA